MTALTLKTAAAWRKWLERHHNTEPDAWLVFYKKHTGKSLIPYQDALDEALCFGWVDVLVKRIDDERYALKYVPRRAGGNWTDANRKRYAELKASGRVAPAGLERGPAGGPGRSGGFGGLERSKTNATPRDILSGLAKHPSALRGFRQLPPSHQREYVEWIESAKRDDTKQRRLAETIKRLVAGPRGGQ